MEGRVVAIESRLARRIAAFDHTRWRGASSPSTVWAAPPSFLQAGRCSSSSSSKEASASFNDGDRDLYSALGIHRRARPEEIGQAYKRLAKECHPDVRPDDPNSAARFREVAHAHATLRNAGLRRLYDLSLLRREGQERLAVLEKESPGGLRGLWRTRPVVAFLGTVVCIASLVCGTTGYIVLKPGAFWSIFRHIPDSVPGKWWLADMYVASREKLGKSTP